MNAKNKAGTIHFSGLNFYINQDISKNVADQQRFIFILCFAFIDFF